MSRRPSPLFRRLGLTGPTDRIFAGFTGSAQVTELAIHHGGDDASSPTPSTLTFTTAQNLNPTNVRTIAVDLETGLADWLAARCGVNTSDIRTRFWGYYADYSTEDTSRGRRHTTVNAVSKMALLQRASITYQPTTRGRLARSPADRFSGTNIRWVEVFFDTPPAGPAWTSGLANDPMTAAEWLDQLSQHGYIISDNRGPYIQIRDVPRQRLRRSESLLGDWPLQRAHVLEPITWTTKPRTPTVTTIAYNHLGETYQAGSYDPASNKVHQHLDFTAFTYDNSQDLAQLDRRLGWDAANSADRGFGLDAVTIPLDHLISSEFEGHRRAAGTLLKLNVGDPIPLGNDWPADIAGMHIVTGITETFTHRGWDMTLQLMPWAHFDGTAGGTVPARVWSQMAGRWSDYSTQEWSDF